MAYYDHRRRGLYVTNILQAVKQAEGETLHCIISGLESLTFQLQVRYINPCNIAISGGHRKFATVTTIS